MTAAVSANAAGLLTAMTWYLPALWPAEYRPAAEMIPPVAAYATFTATLSPFLFLPYAANCCLPPPATDAAAGVTNTCVNEPRFRTVELDVTAEVVAVAVT